MKTTTITIPIEIGYDDDGYWIASDLEEDAIATEWLIEHYDTEICDQIDEYERQRNDKERHGDGICFLQPLSFLH